MILIDTSVIIDLLEHGAGNPKAILFRQIIDRKIPFGISAYSYEEVLQGASNENEFQRLKKYLLAQKIYYLPNELETYENAARMYYDLRRKSITIRSTIDIFIAQTAIYYDLFLLHKDRDFDFIAQNTPELKILEEL